MKKFKRQQQGIALIAAIFLVVVIGAAVVLLASLSSRNAEQTTQSLLQMRAQLAAQAALEYGVQRLVNDPANTAWCTGNQAVSIPAYADFVVALSCSSNQYNRPSQLINLFLLTSTATFGNANANDYVWTQLEATVEL